MQAVGQNGRLRLHESAPPPGIEPLSLANQAAISIRTSRSMRSRLTSRFSSLSSSRASVVTRSLLRSSSRSASFTEFRIGCSEGSNCRGKPTPDYPTVLTNFMIRSFLPGRVMAGHVPDRSLPAGIHFFTSIQLNLAVAPRPRQLCAPAPIPTTPGGGSASSVGHQSSASSS